LPTPEQMGTPDQRLAALAAADDMFRDLLSAKNVGGWLSVVVALDYPRRMAALHAATFAFMAFADRLGLAPPDDLFETIDRALGEAYAKDAHDEGTPVH
jgi:hypothetical protein